VINSKIAKMFGLHVPDKLVALADEVMLTAGYGTKRRLGNVRFCAALGLSGHRSASRFMSTRPTGAWRGPKRKAPSNGA